jgi:hypothetical protein
MMPQTNPIETPADGFEIALPDGRVTTLEALLADARRARAEALRLALRGWAHRIGESLFALVAPALGLTRRHLHHH